MSKGYPKKSKFTPKNPHKYLGDANNIVARSNLETKFLTFLDNNPNIIAYGSEEIHIPYLSPLDNKVHRYFPDLFIKYKTSNGEIKKALIEIKPDSQCKAPKKKGGKKEVTYLNEQVTWAINSAKWEAATKFCESHGIEFKIWTEKHLPK
jgi:hypothetical protein